MTEDTQIRMKRLISEGIVIVISILLAFGIDAKWAQYQVEQEEKVALASIQSEFEQNLKQLDYVINYHLQAREHMSQLFNLPDEKIQQLTQTEISEFILSTSNPITFDPILGTSKSLVDSGKLNIIENPALRTAITSFLNIISDFEEDEYYMRENALDIWLQDVKFGGPWTDGVTERSVNGSVQGFDFIPKISHAEILAVRADPTFKSLTFRYHLNIGYYILELNRAKAIIVEILELLE
ncbi:MAG: hypothetical protein HKP09_00350 [Enterobacterales bacterium]|nr:hypothetical protein [Enterobacterales bacterium]